MNLADEEELGRWELLKNWGQRPPRQKWLHYNVLFPEYSKIVRKLNPKSILDFGCGDGILSAFLHETFPQCRITAFDDAVHMRELARYSLGEVSVVESLQGLHFDMICQNMVLQDIDKPIELLRSLHRIINPNGYLITTLPHPVFSLIESNHVTTRRERVSPTAFHDILRYPFEETEKVFWTNDDTNWTFLYNRMIQTYSELFYTSGYSIISIREPFAVKSGEYEKDLYDIYSLLPGVMVFICARI